MPLGIPALLVEGFVLVVLRKFDLALNHSANKDTANKDTNDL